MKSSKTGNLAKVVAFFLIALVLTCTVAFASSEWQYPTKTPNEPDSGEADEDKSESGNTDENTDGQKPPQNDIPVVNPIPDYLHYLTGEEITQEDAYKRPLCFVYDTNSALYGISSSFLTVEIPIENGQTRFLVFSKGVNTGKIGTLAPSRDYINNIAGSLGGILFCYGNDDSFEYSKGNISAVLNFKEYQGYHYTEYSQYPYTNSDLINAFLRNTSTNTVVTQDRNSPYKFVEYFAESKKPLSKANTVIISHSSVGSTELNYYSDRGSYVLTKMGQPKVDLLNDKVMEFKNVFLLFSNSTTYETEDATQCVIDTVSGGKGYYMTEGGYEEITWGYDSFANLTFFSQDGEKLTVNRGSSYISFIKSSDKSKVKIS